MFPRRGIGTEKFATKNKRLGERNAARIMKVGRERGCLADEKNGNAHADAHARALTRLGETYFIQGVVARLSIPCTPFGFSRTMSCSARFFGRHFVAIHPRNLVWPRVPHSNPPAHLRPVLHIPLRNHVASLDGIIPNVIPAVVVRNVAGRFLLFRFFGFVEESFVSLS